MRASEEPVSIYLFRQNPVLTTLRLRKLFVVIGSVYDPSILRHSGIWGAAANLKRSWNKYKTTKTAKKIVKKSRRKWQKRLAGTWQTFCFKIEGAEIKSLTFLQRRKINFLTVRLELYFMPNIHAYHCFRYVSLYLQCLRRLPLQFLENCFAELDPLTLTN